MSMLLASNNFVAEWIIDSFPVIRIILMSIVAVCALVVIVSTLMQSNSNNNGTSTIGSSRESYYAKNKGESKDVRLSRLTIALVSTMFVCMVVYFILHLVYQG